MIVWDKKKRYKPFVNFELNIVNWVDSGFDEIGSYKLTNLYD